MELIERQFSEELTRMLSADETAPVGALRLNKADLPATPNRLGSNPEAERRAAAKLKLAQTLRNEGLEEDARRYVKELLAQYPNTKAAAEASGGSGISHSVPAPAASTERLSRPVETGPSKR